MTGAWPNNRHFMITVEAVKRRRYGEVVARCQHEDQPWLRNDAGWRGVSIFEQVEAVNW
jgi:hypothetical protein